jgi:hypothetical protein
MTKTLTDMTVSEAASKALEIILAGGHEAGQKNAKEKGYSWYDPEQTWEDAVRAEYEIDEDETFNFLDENSSIWKSVKYEGGKYTKDGLTADRVAEYGGEGDGDQYWVVISISDGTTTRYFRKDGYYASYDGGYLDGDTREVKPAERLVVFYE